MFRIISRQASLVLVVPAVLGLAFTTARAHAKPAFWTTPAVPGYGVIHVWPQEADRPSPRSVSRAVFYIPQPVASPSKPDGELERVARMLNIFTAEKVPLSHLRFVVVFDGGAIPVVLRSATYRLRYHRPNPNAKLLSDLHHDGVKLRVCGVALAGWGFHPSEVRPDIRAVPTGPSTLILYENKGYALVPF